MGTRTFRIILIKPSHYDDDGYVIQWRRSTIPSNSLASVYGLLAACAEQRTLGPDVDIAIEAYDECNTSSTCARRLGASRRRAADSSGSSGSRPTSFPAPSISRALSARRASRS